MAPVVPDPKRIRGFQDAPAFEAWLAKHHAREAELWLKIHKKDSGLRTVTYAEALDVALCWGWIDGIRKALDDRSFLQRFTPRKPKSVWSQVNRRHVARLVAAGRMTEHGQRHVDAAKADGRWDAAYAPASRMTIPEDLATAIQADRKALATFDTLSRQNLYSLAHRIGSVKAPSARSAKIERFVAMLARGETIHPQKAKLRTATVAAAKRPARGLKTAPTEAPVEAFLASIAGEAHADCRKLDAWMRRATGSPGVMYGKGIVGYGTSTIRYADGREAPWMKMGFSPRTQGLALYGLIASKPSSALLGKLGKHSTGKGCLYIKRLADINAATLRALMGAAAK